MKEYQYNELIKLPEEIIKLIDTNISIETELNENINGFLKTIDPISNTLVIQLKLNNQTSLKLIPGHLIKKLISLDNKIEDSDKILYEQLLNKTQQSTNIDSFNETKDKIIKQLELNRLPFKLDALNKSIIIDDICKINLPYREQDIESLNYNVAKNMKKILKDVLFKE